jgi:hypothetical protein
VASGAWKTEGQDLIMPTVQYLCPNCGALFVANFGESIGTGKLTWSMSTQCSACNNYTTEIDGSGPLPDDLREIVLAEEGEWSLSIVDLGQDRVLALKALKQVLGLSAAEMIQLKSHLPANVAVGTKKEMRFLQRQLQGISGELVTEIEST